MSYFEDKVPNFKGSTINTSLMAILHFLGHLFCAIEVSYSEEFVYMIRKMFGLTFREKYKRITRRLPLAIDRGMRVVDSSLFEEMISDQVTFSLFRKIIPADTMKLCTKKPFLMLLMSICKSIDLFILEMESSFLGPLKCLSQ